jgi:hypothetical protein
VPTVCLAHISSWQLVALVHALVTWLTPPELCLPTGPGRRGQAQGAGGRPEGQRLPGGRPGAGPAGPPPCGRVLVAGGPHSACSISCIATIALLAKGVPDLASIAPGLQCTEIDRGNLVSDTWRQWSYMSCSVCVGSRSSPFADAICGEGLLSMSCLQYFFFGCLKI